MEKDTIIKLIQEIKIQLNKIEAELGRFNQDNTLNEKNVKDDFLYLKNLLNSEEWPEAVLEFQIADENSEEDKFERAEGVVDILVQEELKNKKFLDFGCGEGHMAKYASKETLVSVGYDITRPEKSKFEWEKLEEKLLLTRNFEKVIEQSPYDIIMIYDVLDHSENPLEILEKAKSVLVENGTIYLRTHPWCGRHGGHLYRKINKAFVHLVFSEDELKDLGFDLDYNLKVYYPLQTYKELIEKAGLYQVQNHEIETQDVEDFFKNNKIIRERILNSFEIEKWEGTKPKFQMSQCFIDYVLTK